MSSAEGVLTWEPATRHTELLAAPVAEAIASTPSARVAAIDAGLADTAAFCEAYDVAMEHSANCVVVAGKRAGEVRYAAVLVLASMRADINGAVRRHLDVRKISFAPMDQAVSLTGMEFGGITPVGLPADWPVLVDEAVVAAGDVVVGSGIRGSKLLLPAAELAALPSAVVLSLSL
ncbi:prolyl-tRNA editing enzyme YbaK/EbsC (Cys-tRNA(Pro) deacylase) [Phycicoccus badiiscoriae]|uniref:Prolyl-tRNA editing enzyme YbaK/EbsC (Cys-tRNA(Pro) deacylase) n=1 Tax=Pedococcus badiiscoriae TaxID=642776 RepID=A0A852WEN4_9MICO|nr:prolyl-tRNA editing enzyme YbaK/EbsC (Cys-tRNA(Pro) deacylase) [Pedococcus badiiscoriae]